MSLMRQAAMSLHDTPVTYSADEARSIRNKFAHGEGGLICPRCETPLQVGPYFERNRQLFSEIFCGDCNRCIMVRVGTGSTKATQ